MSGKRSGTSSRGKANPWKFTWETCYRVPLLYSRGSAGMCRIPSKRAVSRVPGEFVNGFNRIWLVTEPRASASGFR
jgi:hypothetical protein